MLRFLIILGLIVYVFYKVGSFFFRAGAASQELKAYKQREKAATQTKKGKVKGGEYVDYEEIK
ncbi:hypothetical protein [Ohtaekwangia sp.]|jgi:uncharacterized protein HemY|uniref:hypothetical protein n=1 Tax=Ohtaekwangia sp. TaxID=2066019 RepID=UPI002F943C3C